MKKLNIILSLILFASFTSCKKGFLEIVDKTVLLKQGYVVDLETTGHFMNGIYSDLATYYAAGAYLPYPEIMADNMKPTNSTAFPAAYNWNFQTVTQSGFGDPVQMWIKYYGIIRNCSFVIEKTEEFKGQNSAMADELKGQALAVRSLMHFTLVNMFAQPYSSTADATHPGIPYIQVSDIESSVSRQTVAEVYIHLIDDLTMALQLLPKRISNKEKMNYHAAKALLGRIYLFKEDYAEAKNVARQVLNDIPIMTSNYPGSLYTFDETEALFRIPPGASAAENYNAILIGFRARSANPFYLATTDIANILKENTDDKRSAWVTQFPGKWIISKFPKGATGLFPAPDGDYYQTLLRSSEMCLTAAEAYANLNIEDSARFYIDAIRLRANPSLTNITATGTALLDSIYKERRKEMCFDGLRMWDLLRWKKGVLRSDPNTPDVQMLPYPSNKAIAAIPKQDVELSGLQQNPGY